jgi:hypothetical protein
MIERYASYGSLRAASRRKWRIRSSVEGGLDRYPPFADSECDSANFLRASASNARRHPIANQERRSIVVSLLFEVLRVLRLHDGCRRRFP